MGPTDSRPSLAEIRSVGCWAYVSVPDDPTLPCLIHFWHRKGLDPILVARMLAHELGHISDGGPKDWIRGPEGEEERAEEFARVTAEAVGFLLFEGLLVRPEGRRRRTS